VKFVQEEEK